MSLPSLSVLSHLLLLQLLLLLLLQHLLHDREGDALDVLLDSCSQCLLGLHIASSHSGEECLRRWPTATWQGCVASFAFQEHALEALHVLELLHELKRLAV